VIALTRCTSRRVRRLAQVSAAVLAIAWVPAIASATPSTTYWAPSVATCQAAGVPHITYDSYFGKAGGYPVDTGLTVGLIPGSKVNAEVGYDLLLPSSDPIQFYLNGKVCVPENAMGKGAPAIGGGVYSIGFKKGVTDYNIAYGVVQKSLPIGGYLSGGAYYGMKKELFLSSDGKDARVGAIVGWLSPDIKPGIKGISKIDILADVQTGKNAFGGGGAGLDIYFNDYVGIITGPVFFFDKKLQPGGKSWLWTVQLDVDIPLGKN
jgi:hypothetical protein